MEKNNKKHDETMKQKLILLILFCLCTLGVAAQGVVTRQKPRQNTTQPATPGKPRQNTQQRQKPRQNTQTRTQNSGAASTATARTSSGGSNKTFTANGVSFTMVYVQGGTFTMGATSEQWSEAYNSEAYNNEKPAHSVTLSSYYMGETEVTQALWEAVMGSLPSDISSSSYDLRGPQRPVCYVSWDDCQTFVSRLNSLTGQQFHLPTEAQWEYAARGGTKSRGYKYSGSNDVGSVAWYTSNTNDKGSHDVKTKQANELGLYDMSGNVWEWCQDRYGSYSSGSQTNPTGASSGSDRVYRGGSWFIGAWNCRVSRRHSRTPSLRDYYLGLRLAL